MGNAAQPDLQRVHRICWKAASVIGFGVYVPKIGVFISIFSVVGMQLWYVMIAVTLLRLCNRTTQPALPDGKVPARETA